MKNKSSVFFVGFLVLVLILVEVYKPQPMDWKPSLSKSDDIPYGSKILFDLLPNLFSDQSVREVYQPIYNQLTDWNDTLAYNGNETANYVNYLLLNSRFQFDDLDLEELLHFVAEGNHAFIAAENFPDKLLDTLGLQINHHYCYWGQDTLPTYLNFSAESLHTDSGYVYKCREAYTFFDQDATNFSTPPITLLGNRTSLSVSSPAQHISEGTNKTESNFLYVSFGKGKFYLHANPLVFTNYNMVKANNAEYVAKALSYLPKGNIVWWDEYYKVGRLESNSPLRYILSNTALRWALYISVLGMLLFMFFEGKRRQRVIPIKEPLRNTTVEFVQTVGALYYQNGNHKDIAEKKITYLFDFIRSRFLLRSIQFTPIFYQQLADKSGVDVKGVEQLFQQMIRVKKQSEVTEKDLLKLNNLVEQFYAQTA